MGSCGCNGRACIGLKMREAGIKIIIASNNHEQRVKQFAEPHGIPFIFRAKKPLGSILCGPCSAAFTSS